MVDEIGQEAAKHAYRTSQTRQETEQTNRARLPAGVVIESSAHVLRSIDTR